MLNHNIIIVIFLFYCVIIFKTPAYRDQSIYQPQKVYVQLRRKKDQTCHSEPVEFKYTPKSHGNSYLVVCSTVCLI